MEIRVFIGYFLIFMMLLPFTFLIIWIIAKIVTIAVMKAKDQYNLKYRKGYFKNGI